MSKFAPRSQQALFLKTLREAREDMGLTQVELAKRLKRHQSFVSKSELGERRLDVIELRLVCKGIGITLADFIKRLEQNLK